MRLTRDLEINISEGTKNITVIAHVSSKEEVIELIDYALKEARKTWK